MNKTNQSIEFVFRYRFFEKLVLPVGVFPMKYTGSSLIENQIVAHYHTRLDKRR